MCVKLGLWLENSQRKLRLQLTKIFPQYEAETQYQKSWCWGEGAKIKRTQRISSPGP